MGDHIANALLPLLKRDEQLAQARAQARRPRSKPDDSVDFEEEGGSHRNISQGYIVVRKKDLD